MKKISIRENRRELRVCSLSRRSTFVYLCELLDNCFVRIYHSGVFSREIVLSCDYDSALFELSKCGYKIV